jgi:CheY-like chemotaxis protein
MKRIRVLVVDDDPEVRDALGWILSGAGMTVALTASVRAARAILPKFLPDVVVSDFIMPHGSGLNFARELRQTGIALRRRIGAVAVTGLTGPESHQLAIGAGFDAFFVKPCDPVQLVSTLRELSAKTAGAVVRSGNLGEARPELSGKEVKTS